MSISEEDGALVFDARGIVSKRLGSLYRSPHWVKVKNPAKRRR
jgi:hypothetical protein